MADDDEEDFGVAEEKHGMPTESNNIRPVDLDLMRIPLFVNLGSGPEFNHGVHMGVVCDPVQSEKDSIRSSTTSEIPDIQAALERIENAMRLANMGVLPDYPGTASAAEAAPGINKKTEAVRKDEEAAQARDEDNSARNTDAAKDDEPAKARDDAADSEARSAKDDDEPGAQAGFKEEEEEDDDDNSGLKSEGAKDDEPAAQARFKDDDGDDDDSALTDREPAAEVQGTPVEEEFAI